MRLFGICVWDLSKTAKQRNRHGFPTVSNGQFNGATWGLLTAESTPG
jgi:hypothetical protein